MLTPMSLHSLSQKKLQLPTVITRSHLVPGKQIQALHFPELISGDVLQKDEMRLMQHRKAQRVCLRRAHKGGGNVSLTLFVVPQFLVRSLTRVFMHTRMQTRCVQCMHKPSHTHRCAHTRNRTHSTTLRAASEYYK